jgi:hypothetical protein
MRYQIYKNSHTGIGLMIFELIITMICLNGSLELATIKIHPAIRLVICIITAIIMLIIFSSSRIGCIIISIFYSVIWTLITVSITSEFTQKDKIWMVVIGVITFLISIAIHMSSMIDSGANYTITDENY